MKPNSSAVGKRRKKGGMEGGKLTQNIEHGPRLGLQKRDKEIGEREERREDKERRFEGKKEEENVERRGKGREEIKQSMNIHTK